jgi:hypothetical protein
VLQGVTGFIFFLSHRLLSGHLAFLVEDWLQTEISSGWWEREQATGTAGQAPCSEWKVLWRNCGELWYSTQWDLEKICSRRDRHCGMPEGPGGLQRGSQQEGRPNSHAVLG